LKRRALTWERSARRFGTRGGERCEAATSGDEVGEGVGGAANAHHERSCVRHDACGQREEGAASHRYPTVNFFRSRPRLLFLRAARLQDFYSEVELAGTFE
jgi:hypothetical protein